MKPTKYKPYPSYKPSGIDWLGKIPDEWERFRIKNIVKTKISDGPHETPEFINEGVPFISAEAIQDNGINFEAARGFISKELDLLYSQKTKPRLNDIFLVKSGSTTGKVSMVLSDVDFNIWSPIALIRVKDNKFVPRYIFYCLLSECLQKKIQQLWSFGTQPNIGMGVIENLFSGSNHYRTTNHCRLPRYRNSPIRSINNQKTAVDRTFERKATGID